MCPFCDEDMVPYAFIVVIRRDYQLVRCPTCSALVKEVERKDFESFSSDAYGEHWQREHLAAHRAACGKGDKRHVH